MQTLKNLEASPIALDLKLCMLSLPLTAYALTWCYNAKTNDMLSQAIGVVHTKQGVS